MIKFIEKGEIIPIEGGGTREGFGRLVEGELIEVVCCERGGKHVVRRRLETEKLGIEKRCLAFNGRPCER